MNNEEEIIEIFKNKEVNEIKNFFKENNIKIKNLNYLKDVTLYLIENNFSFDKIKLILDIVKNTSIVTSKVLCQLIKLKKIELIKKIFQYQYFDIHFIVNLLLYYKNKTEISKGELQNKINNLNQSIIKINNKTETGNYSLLEAINNNNTEIVKLLIKYSNKNNIILELNEKDEKGYSPLLVATYKDNIDIVKLLIEYANTNNIILELNEKGIDGNYPILEAINNNNTEIVKLLIEYANKNNIILKLNKKDKYEIGRAHV